MSVKLRSLLGFVSVLLIAVGAVLYVSTRPPFAFLAGRSRSVVSAEDRKQFTQDETEIAAYTFKANWPRFLKEAKAELKAEDFKEGHSGLPSGALAYCYPDETVLSSPKSQEYGRAVLLVKDCRYTIQKGLMGVIFNNKPEEGWVTVLIGERGEPSVWRHISRWLGL